MRNQKEKVNNVQNQLYPPPQKKKYVDTKGNKYFQVQDIIPFEITADPFYCKENFDFLLN